MGKLLGIFTTATKAGVSTRYLTVILGSILTILGIIGWLSAEQVEALRDAVPAFVAALGALVAAVIPIYAALTKSSSDKAAEVARQVDAQIPEADEVVIARPGAGKIVVPPKPGGR